MNFEYFIGSKWNNFDWFVELWDLVDIKWGKRIPKWKTYSQNFVGYKYLRVDDLDENWLFVFDNLKNIDEQVYNSIRNYFIEKENLCVSIAGTIWKIALIEEDFDKKLILTENCAKLIIKDKNIILPKYLKFILKSSISQNQFESNYWQETIAKLSLERLKQTKIPVPPLDIQQQIVEKMDQALSEKQRLESESEKILESIDEYVLWELGIELSKEQEEKMCFSINLEEILENKRFDPFYLQNTFNIEKSKHKITNVFDIAEIKKWQSITQSNITEWDFPVIAWWQTSPYNHNKKNYDWNIITVSASWAYSWYVRYHEYPIFASDCSVVFSKDEDNISTKFVYIWLKSNQSEIYKMQKWAWQPHVYPDDIWNFPIPLPPIEIQKKIIDIVNNKIKEAKNKEQEAKEIYEAAKKEIEEMILI